MLIARPHHFRVTPFTHPNLLLRTPKDLCSFMANIAPARRNLHPHETSEVQKSWEWIDPESLLHFLTVCLPLHVLRMLVENEELFAVSNLQLDTLALCQVRYFHYFHKHRHRKRYHSILLACCAFLIIDGKRYLKRYKSPFHPLNHHLKVVHSLSHPTDAWEGRRGHVDIRLIQDEIPDYADRVFFFSGPPSLVTDLERAIRTLHIPDDRIKSEAFLGYDGMMNTLVRAEEQGKRGL